MGQKTALVTGAGRGIGQKIALHLAQAGYDLAINFATSSAEAEKTAGEIRALGRKAEVYQADIRRIDAINAMFERFARDFDHLDLLVNNAGITRFAPFLETPPDLWDEVIQTDFRGAFFCSQAAAKLMIARGTKGVIINITSNQAAGCWPHASIYAAAKAAVDKLTKNTAMELAKFGIRALSVAPGYTRTEWMDEADASVLGRYDGIAGKIPLNRFASREEIAEVVVFLASDKAGYITGTTLMIDGGALLPVLAENDF